MPQLDLLTFFTQFFWAVLCLFLFYFFVSKLILPELTRALKYRSKASSFSSAGDNLVSQTGQERGGDTLSHSSESLGSSTLYKYAVNSSARVLTEARQKRNTFLDSVISGKTIERSASKSSESSYSTSTASTKTQGDTKQNKNSIKGAKGSKSPSTQETVTRSDSAKSPKGLKGSKNLARDPKNSKESDSFKS